MITAYLNHHGLKHAVLAELQRGVGSRAKLSVFGDRWVFAHRTGRREVFDDVGALAHALVEHGLVGRGAAPPAGADAEFERLLETRGCLDEPTAAPLGAGELVAALLFSADPV